MLNQAFNEANSLFTGTFMIVLQTFLRIAISILRIVLPAALFALVMISKGVVLLLILLIMSSWTYWRNIGILWGRLQAAPGASNFFDELRLYGYATLDDLRFQSDPFSVVTAVQNTQFYIRYISFVDAPPSGQVTMSNLMSLGWIAQMLDIGLTRIAKLSMPIAIELSELIFIPVYAIVIMVRRIWHKHGQPSNTFSRVMRNVYNRIIRLIKVQP